MKAHRLRPASTVVISGSGEGALQNRFHIAALTFQRARQLCQGARPRVEREGHTVLRLALLEVMADTVTWTVT